MKTARDGSSSSADSWQPTSPPDRLASLDVLRGLALFGVLVVNLTSSFRVSLFHQMAGLPDPAPGPAFAFLESAIHIAIEFKAFALFAFLFGAGAAIQRERASARQVSPTRFLLRRFLVLFVIGVMHIVILWNGDILALYGLIGFLLVPMLGLSPRRQILTGSLAIALPFLVPLPIHWPSSEQLGIHAREAARSYCAGTYPQILIFRLQEARGFILPLWIAVMPRTLGMMLLGAAAWRTGLLSHPAQHRKFLKGFLAAAASLALASLLLPALPAVVREFGAPVLQSLAYAAAFLLWVHPQRLPGIAALGRMALTNYLLQSLVFSFVFYGYGLGLFNRLPLLQTLLLGTVVYLAQIRFSRYWLRRHAQGPVERIWRALAYRS